MKKVVSWIKHSKGKSLDSETSQSSIDSQSFDSETSQSSDNSSCHGRIVQVEGDLQPSSSSHVSESFAENRTSPPPSLDRQSSLDGIFVTPKLDFMDDFESCQTEEGNSCEVRISLGSVSNSSIPQESYDSSHSLTTTEKEKNPSFLSEDSRLDDNDSYFHTASVESDNENQTNSPPRPNRVVVSSRNEIANKTTCGQDELSRNNPKPSDVIVNVFLTYALEPKVRSHMNSIASMAATFHKFKYEHQGPTGTKTYELNFTADVYERQLASLSKSSWLDGQLKKADFVLVCVSPSYSEMVEEKTVAQDIGESSYDNTVHTQYIYTRMHSEYINNSSKNERFIPVLFSGATRDNVPSWLRDTLIYRWDVDYKGLLFRLIKQEEHMKPAPGPPPVLQMRSRFPECGVSGKRRS